MKLYKRKIFERIEPYLGDDTVIVLIGARQVGKTYVLFYVRDWLAQRGKKVFYYDLEYPELLEDLNKGVEVFVADLRGKGYVEGEEIYALVDEIQYLDNPSPFLKIMADHYKNIHLIVSGSSTFDIKSKFSDSLAGRTTMFEVFPLTFAEFMEFREEELSLADVSSPSGIARLVQLYGEFVKYGGYPKVVLESAEEKRKQYLLQVIDAYIRKDVRDLAKVDDTRKFNNMLKVLASQSGRLLDMASLSRETNISFPTLQKYLAILEETFVIARVAPYSRNPSVEISKNPKVFFYDSGMLSLLRFNDFQGTMPGEVFETSVFGELVKKYGRNAIYFWRTKAGAEIDFVVEKDGGKIMPLEAKTNFQRFNARAMKSFEDKYKAGDGKVVGLEGNKLPEYGVFPWEV